jgi:site-specific recombinase XerD
MNGLDTPAESDTTISQYINHLRKSKMSRSTIKAYASDLRGFLSHSGLRPESTDVTPLVAVKTSDLESYLHTLVENGSKFATVKRASSALKNFFSFLVSQGVVQDNPAQFLAVRPSIKDLLSSQQILSIFEYLGQRQQSSDHANIVRYRRDELILLMMLFYGVRQYQLSTLRLSAIHNTKESVSLIISTKLSFTLHAFVVKKLRLYLEARKSNSDMIFLDPLTGRPLNHAGIQHLLNELSFALHFKCGPRSLYNTYLHLRQNPDTREQLIAAMLSRVFNHNLASLSHG